MQQTTDWLKQLFDPVAWADVHPGEILLIWLSAAALVLVGWVIASLLRRVSLRLLLGAGRIGRRFSGIAESGDPRFAKAATRVIASIVFWGVLLVFLVLAGRILGLSIIDRGVEALVDYLPSLGLGIAIILVGIILGSLAYPIVARGAQSAGLKHGEQLGRITQITITAAAGVVGATEFGLDVSFVTNVALLVLGAAGGAFALGLALGTPLHVRNIIAARNVSRLFRVGDIIAIDEYRGTVAAIGSTHVVLESEQGEILIPAQRFAETAFARIAEDDHGSR